MRSVDNLDSGAQENAGSRRSVDSQCARGRDANAATAGELAEIQEKELDRSGPWKHGEAGTHPGVEQTASPHWPCALDLPLNHVSPVSAHKGQYSTD